MKSSNIGGQAVLEGIMMRHEDEYAVAVRTPEGEIVVQKETYKSIVKWKKLTEIPFVRGVFNFIDSMRLGIKILSFSAGFYEEEDEAGEKKQKAAEHDGGEEKEGKMGESLMMGFAMALAVVLALAATPARRYLLGHDIR